MHRYLEHYRNPLLIAVGVFLFSLTLQTWWMQEYVLVDADLWAAEVAYMQDGDPRQYDFLAGYGHPGGPVIESVMAMHRFFAWPYTGESVERIIAVLVSIGTALAAVLAYLLRPASAWWVGVAGILSLSWLYSYATPPSMLIGVLVPCLLLLTLVVMEKRLPLLPALGLWMLIAGASLATRFDTGSLFVLLALILLYATRGVRTMVLAGIGTFVAFVALNPFMWKMPIQHLFDLLHKIFYHYAEFGEVQHLSLLSVISISTLAWISMALALINIAMRRRLPLLIPGAYLLGLGVTTVVLYVILLSSRYQAERYFIPLLLVWEILLPLFLLHFIRHDGGAGTSLSKKMLSGVALALLLSSYVVVWIFGMAV